MPQISWLSGAFYLVVLVITLYVYDPAQMADEEFHRAHNDDAI